MTFARANALGWAAFEELTASQMNAGDAQWPAALDAGAGGAYAPTGDVDLSNGSGGFLKLSGTTHWPKLETREVLLPQGLTVAFMTDRGSAHEYSWANNGNADWTAPIGLTGTLYQYFVDATGAAVTPIVWFEMARYPLLATLKSARVDIHHPTTGSDPTQRPKAEVWILDNSVGNAPTVQNIGTAVNVAANYRSATPTVTKSIEVTFSPFAPTEGRRLFLALYGEANSGAVAGLRALQVYLKADISWLRH